VFQLGGDGEGGLDGERGEGVDEQHADAFIEVMAGDGGADRPPVGDAVALADVGGQVPAVALVVADGHAGAAAAADDDALQQGRSLAGRSGGAVRAAGGGIGGQSGAVDVVLAQGDVSGVDAGDEGDPVLAGQQPGGHLPAGLFVVGVPAIGERTGIAGVVQHPQHGVVLQRLPVQLALAWSLQMPPGEGQFGGVERLHARGGRPGRVERREQVVEGFADCRVGVEDDVPGGVVDQPDGQWGAQFSAAGFGQHPAAEPGLDEVQFGLATSKIAVSEAALGDLCGLDGVEADGVAETVGVAGDASYDLVGSQRTVTFA